MRIKMISSNSKRSLNNGVLTEETYNSDNKRRMISLKICFVAWLCEFSGSLFAMLTPFLKRLGVSNRHYPDAIIMFIVIPLIHLMNDEETKAIIYAESWYQGLRHTLGFRKKNI